MQLLCGSLCQFHHAWQGWSRNSRISCYPTGRCSSDCICEHWPCETREITLTPTETSSPLCCLHLCLRYPHRYAALRTPCHRPVSIPVSSGCGENRIKQPSPYVLLTIAHEPPILPALGQLLFGYLQPHTNTCLCQLLVVIVESARKRAK